MDVYALVIELRGVRAPPLDGSARAPATLARSRALANPRGAPSLENPCPRGSTLATPSPQPHARTTSAALRHRRRAGTPLRRDARARRLQRRSPPRSRCLDIAAVRRANQ